MKKILLLILLATSILLLTSCPQLNLIGFEIEDQTVMVGDTLSINLRKYINKEANDPVVFEILYGVGEIEKYDYTYTPQESEIGFQSVQIRATDFFGLTHTCAFFIEVTPRVNKVPTLQIVSGPAETTNASVSNFEWVGNDSDGSVVKYEYRKDNGDWTDNGTSTKYEWNDYNENSHTFEVRAQDSDLAYSSIIRWDFSYLPDNKIPVIHMIGGLQGNISQVSNSFTWDGDDPDGEIVKYEYKKDEGDWTNNGTETAYTWIDYNEGLHSFNIRALDNEGAYSNSISWSFTYQQDNIPPVVVKVGGLEGAVTQNSNVFSWTGSDEDGTIKKYEFRKDNGDWEDNATETTYTWTGYSERNHSFEVRALDDGEAYSDFISWNFIYGTGSVIPGEIITVGNGSFLMGDTWGDSFGDEKPVHKVTLTYNFYIGKYEMTNKEFSDFLNDIGANPDGSYRDKILIDISSEYCRIANDGTVFHVLEGFDNYPLIMVSWWGAIEYCNWLSEKEGYSKAYDISGNLLDSSGATTTDIESVEGYRLPTEAEWEYAARGGNAHSPYMYSGSDNADVVSWYSKNSTGNSNGIGKKMPNALDTFDMSGNVWEWCSDYYGDYPDSDQTNPYMENGTDKVYRGGSWRYSSSSVRVTYRFSAKSDYSDEDLGFRICRTIN